MKGKCNICGKEIDTEYEGADEHALMMHGGLMDVDFPGYERGLVGWRKKK